MSKPNMTDIPTERRGRPRSVRIAAEKLIGTAGVEALAANDLYIISGDLAREFSVLVGEPLLPKPPEVAT